MIFWTVRHRILLHASAVKAWSNTDPTINVAAGATVTGGAGAAAIELDGPVNVVNDDGTLLSTDGAGGTTVLADSGDTTINNGGVLNGDVQLTANGSNLLHNLAGGTIGAGPTIDLGGTCLRSRAWPPRTLDEP